MVIRRWFLSLAVFALAAAGLAENAALSPPARDADLLANRQALPDFDSRRDQRVRISSTKLSAVKALQSSLGSSGKVTLSSSTGGVHHIFNVGAPLSAPQGGDARALLDQYIVNNAAVFGLSREDLETFKTALRNTDDVGVTHLYLSEEINGIRVFGTLIKGHVKADGSVISVEGEYYPGLTAPSAGPTLSAEEAVRAAMLAELPDLLQKAVPNNQTSPPSGSDTIFPASLQPAQGFPEVTSPSSGSDLATVFARGPLQDDITARLVIFPEPNGTSVYGWQVYLHAADRQASYMTVVDARSGAVLYRTNTYRSAINSNASIFPKNPDATPLTVVPYFGNPQASPIGWSNGPATIGNNVQADSATSTGDFVFPFGDTWKTVGLNNFDLASTRLRFTPVDALATGYTLTVGAAGSTAPAATNLLPFFTNTDDGTINLICGGGWSANVLGATFTSFFVNTNGSLSFGAGITDSFPSKVSFSNDARRAAGVWKDLNPGGGGTLTGDCAPEGGGTRIRVVWNAVPNFPSGGSHTFAIVVHGIGTGLDNVIDIDYGAVSSATGVLVGVGGNSGAPFNPTTTGVVSYRDLSAGASPGVPGGIAQTFPDPDLNLSITNFGAHLNFMHDFYYGLGFTESAGNYQTSNFNKGGAPLDPVQAEAQFGLGVFNNAFFQFAPDGTPGFTAFGLFSTGGGSCRRDSGFDSGVIYHEATHGVSTRMVGGPHNVNTLNSFQGGALGEGWSDAYPIAIQNDPVLGAYVLCNPAGIRSAPYNAHPGVYRDFGNKDGPFASGIGTIFTPEVHQDGEIWAATMWDIKTALGPAKVEQLMFDGFKYTPIEPSFLDARNAILVADSNRYGGADISALWTAFAARGMGSSATVSDGSFSSEPLYNGWETVVFSATDTPSAPYPPNRLILLSEDFEGTAPGWTTAGVDGAGGGPLWHLTSRRASSGSKSFYYGKEATGNYNTGFRNYGELLSPEITLPATAAGTAIILEWDQFRATGDPFFFDAGVVRALDVVAGTRTQMAFVQNTLTSFANADFLHQMVDLTPFAGKKIKVIFYMDTFDSIANSTEGWYVDNVRVSQTVSAAVNLPPTSDLVIPNSGTGTSQLFTGSWSDQNGFTDINGVYMLFNQPLAGTNACFVFYIRSTNLLYLALDNNTNPLPPLTPGTATSVENSQCRLNALKSGAVGGGQTLNVNFDITFKTALTGVQNIWMNVYDNGGLSSGWLAKGTWTIPAFPGNVAPTADAVSPNAGSGLAQAFTFTYSDPNGYADIRTAYALINNVLNGANACFVFFYRPNNSFYLVNDANTAALTPNIPVGTTGTVENSQCKLLGSGSTVVGASNTLTMTVNIQFKSPAFAGAKNIYMNVFDAAGLSSGWFDRGDWTVP